MLIQHCQDLFPQVGWMEVLTRLQFAMVFTDGSWLTWEEIIEYMKLGCMLGQIAVVSHIIRNCCVVNSIVDYKSS